MKTNLPPIPPISTLFAIVNKDPKPLEPAVHQPLQKYGELPDRAPKLPALVTPASMRPRGDSLERLTPVASMRVQSLGVSPMRSAHETPAPVAEVVTHGGAQKRARSSEESSPLPSPKRLHVTPAQSLAVPPTQTLPTSLQASASPAVAGSSNTRQFDDLVLPTLLPARQAELGSKYGVLKPTMTRNELRTKAVHIDAEQQKLKIAISKRILRLRQIIPKDFEPKLQEASQKVARLTSAYVATQSDSEKTSLYKEKQHAIKSERLYSRLVKMNTPEGVENRKNNSNIGIKKINEEIIYLSKFLLMVKNHPNYS
jgi:hypothetical protein